MPYLTCLLWSLSFSLCRWSPLFISNEIILSNLFIPLTLEKHQEISRRSEVHIVYSCTLLCHSTVIVTPMANLYQLPAVLAPHQCWWSEQKWGRSLMYIKISLLTWHREAVRTKMSLKTPCSGWAIYTPSLFLFNTLIAFCRGEHQVVRCDFSLEKSKMHRIELIS